MRRDILAIAMWDFSWLERRYIGGGFEDWDVALDQLVERGYNAVRIDCYPHLIWKDATANHTLIPCWTEHDWGCTTECTVQIQPNLNIFMRKCMVRGVKVALSNWCRQDNCNTVMEITSPEVLIDMWHSALQSIDSDLLDNILYLDLLNEPPIRNYAPFLDSSLDLSRSGQYFNNWMRTAIEGVRKLYPQYPITISSAMLPDWQVEDNSFMDFVDLHLWMSSGEFYAIVGYMYENYDPIGYTKVRDRAEALYNINPEYWKYNLSTKIQAVKQYSIDNDMPIVATECWALTNYKDMPGLNWHWIKQLCQHGTIEAVNTGRYLAIATSNFCSPQFVGMWSDVEWHRHMTDIIRNGVVDSDLDNVFRCDSKKV